MSKDMMQMEMTVYNPQKGRLETINAVLTEQNTTWFENCVKESDIYTITDFEGGLLIKEYGYRRPTWIYDISRADVAFSQKRAKRKLKEIKALYK
jgi:hypothetical protein